jgi:hypothetical protein
MGEFDKYERFYGPADLPIASVDVVSNPAGVGSTGRRILDKIRLVNHSASVTAVTLLLNGTQAPNVILSGEQILGNGYLEFGGLVLNPGDILSGKASAADRISLSIYGRDVGA